MRRSSAIVAFALSVLLVVPIGETAGMGAAAEPLDVLTVFAGDLDPVTSSFDLVQGQEYSVVLTGTGTYSYGTDSGPNYFDALYGYGTPAFDPPGESGHLNHRIGDGEFINSALPGRPPGGPPAAPPYNDDHRYVWTFTAPASGLLSYRDTAGTGPENSEGRYRIEIYGAGRVPDPGTVTVSEPAPGQSVSVVSPDQLPRNGGTVKVGVTNSSGDLNDTTVVGEGEVKKIPRQIGEAIAACWFIGPDAFEITGKADNLVVHTDVGVLPLKKLIRGSQELFKNADATFALDICLSLGRRIAQSYEESSTTQERLAAETAGSGCRVKRVALNVSSRNGRVTRVRLSETQGRPASAPRYSCTSTAAGELDMTVTHGRNTSLRDSLGKKLNLGAVRQANAVTRDATLTFGFE